MAIASPEAQRRVGALRRGDIERDHRGQWRRHLGGSSSQSWWLIASSLMHADARHPRHRAARRRLASRRARSSRRSPVSAGAAVRTMTDASSSGCQKTGASSARGLGRPGNRNPQRRAGAIGPVIGLRLRAARRPSDSRGCGGGIPRPGRRARVVAGVFDRRLGDRQSSFDMGCLLSGITGCLGL